MTIFLVNRIGFLAYGNSIGVHNFYLVEFNINSITVKTKIYLIKTLKINQISFKFTMLHIFVPHTDLASWPRITLTFAGLYLQTRASGGKVSESLALLKQREGIVAVNY